MSYLGKAYVNDLQTCPGVVVCQQLGTALLKNVQEYSQNKSICLSACMCSYEPVLACWHVLSRYVCVSQKPQNKVLWAFANADS